MATFYLLLADAIVLLHASYVAFIVLGQAAILLGAALRWKWTRNPYFRWVHLAAIAIVAIEAALGWTCPLTLWENDLRAAAGGDFEPGAFMPWLASRVLFLDLPDWAFPPLHMAFGVLVIATMLVYPPAPRGTAATPDSRAEKPMKL